MVLNQNINQFQATINLLSSVSIGSLAGNGVVNLDGFTLTTGTNNTGTTFSGIVGTSGGDTGGITKVGTGFFRLASVGTYNFSGAVNVNGGILIVDGILTAGVGTSNEVTVNTGGTLGGSGTLNRALLVNSGGTVSPGDSGLPVSAIPPMFPNPSTPATGILTTGTGGNVTFMSGSTFAVDLNPDSTSNTQPVAGTDYDQLIADGTITLNGPNLSGTSNNVIVGSSLTIILNAVNNTSPNPITGSSVEFNSAAEDGFVDVGGVYYNITYRGNPFNSIPFNHNDVVLTLPGRYEFGTASSPVATTSGYTGVSNGTVIPASPTATSIGWATAPLAVDRGTPNTNNPADIPLQSLDFQNAPDIFYVHVVQSGTYRVTVTLGDSQVIHDNMMVSFPNATNVVTEDPTLLTSQVGQFVTATYDVTIPGLVFEMQLSKPLSGNLDPNWVINALNIQPDFSLTNTAVEPLTLMRLATAPSPPALPTAAAPVSQAVAPNPASPVLFTAVGGFVYADGLTTDTYMGSGAAPGAIIIVSSTLNGSPGTPFGTLSKSQDFAPDNYYASVEVQASMTGTFTFQVVRPTGTGPGVIEAYEVTGLEYGVALQPYTLPTTRHLEFNPAAVSPATTATGYLGVSSVVYNSPTVNALGWVGAAPLSISYATPAGNTLLQGFDFNSIATYELVLPNGVSGGTQYEITATMGDSQKPHVNTNILASVNGSPFTSVLGGNLVSNVAGQFPVVSFVVTAGAAAGGSSTIQLEFVNQGNVDPNFVLNALDVQPAANEFGALTLSRTTVGSTQSAISSGGTFNSEAATGNTDTYQLSGVPANAIFTVGVTGATITSADVNGNIAGVQVQANGSGVATFTVLQPTGASTAVFTINEVTPQALANVVSPAYSQLTGTFTQPYTVPPPPPPPPLATYNFAFDTPGSAATETVAGITYTSVPESSYTTAKGYGWTTAINAINRGTPSNNVVLEAFNYASNATFRVDLPAGTYTITATMGDGAGADDDDDILSNVSGTFVSVLGSNLVGNAAGQFTSTTFTLTVPSTNTLSLEFLDRGGSDPNFVLNSLQIRPMVNVLPINISQIASAVADGQTTDTFTGTITGGSALAGSFVTVATSLGTVNSTDASTTYTGIQSAITASGSNGVFTFTVLRPTLAATATFTVTEIDGRASTQVDGSPQTQTYAVPALRQLAFIPSGAPVETTPVSMIGVLPGAVYATQGFGWTTTPLALDRGGAPGTDYREDSFHYDSIVDSFQVQVLPNTTYMVRAYIFDSAGGHNASITVGSTTTTVNSVAGVLSDPTFSMTTTGSQTTLLITIQVLANSTDWVLNGLDISSGSLPSVQPELATSVVTNTKEPSLTQAELAPIAAAAVQRLAATGLSAAQVAELKAITYVIQPNLAATTGALGLTALNSEVVTLDATGAGHGWFIDPTPTNDDSFRNQVSTSELLATNAAAATGYDLLTVLMHEDEHVLGVSDVSAAVSPNVLMTNTLSIGVRRLPKGEAPLYVNATTSLSPSDVATLTQAQGSTASAPLFNVSPATTAAFVSSPPVVATAITNNGRQTSILGTGTAKPLTTSKELSDVLAGDRGSDPLK